jgi:AraC family transcriptional regulator of adaptative response/methylated-DNA-[protein]-cysteine methyltransferase
MSLAAVAIVNEAGRMKRVVVGIDLRHAIAMNEFPFLDSNDYARIERAIVYVSREFRAQPSLAQIASQVQLSPAHFNRLFRRWAGITPKQFIQRLTLDAAKAQLREAHSVMRAALEAGLSGPSRLHDLFITLEAMTPGEYKRGGAELSLSYGVADTPFGPAHLVWSERGLCQLEFLPEQGDSSLYSHWPNAQWRRDDAAALQWTRQLWQGIQAPGQSLRLLVKGSNFQLQVWRALLNVGSQNSTDYGSLAASVQRPSAARAVGNAVGANPVLWLIPCHRVLRANGGLGGYRGGVPRKQMMLAWEYAQRLGDQHSVE